MNQYESELWVATNLRSYCEPGQHTFVMASERLRWCTRCFKEERVDRPTCLVCDGGAKVGGVLLSDETEISGGLCQECFTGLPAGSAYRLAFDPT